jgi:transposase
MFFTSVSMCRKAKHAIAIAESGRDGEVRNFGEIEATPAAVERFVRKLEKKCPRLHFCYEAGPTGYGFYRQIVDLGHRCDVVAPSLIPKRAGERVKTNRRDAVSLARLLRAGELKGIWVPDAVHEAVRDLMRVRTSASEDLRKKRQQCLSRIAYILVGGSALWQLVPFARSLGDGEVRAERNVR